MGRFVAIFLLGIAAGVGGLFVYRSFVGPERSGGGPEQPATAGHAGAAKAPRESVVALGTLEPRDGVVQISSPLVGYRIKQVRVQDGQLVKEGDVLIELDDASISAEHELALAQRAEALEQQQSSIALAKERVATAQLAVKQASDGRQLEIDGQHARIAVAAAKKEEAQKAVERLEEMRKLAEPLASQVQVDEQQVMAKAAAAEYDAAKIALSRLEQTLTFQEQTAKAEQHAAEQSLALAEKGPGIESLNRRVELAELKLKQAAVTAPNNGMVLSVMAHPGEIVAQQPLLQLADLDNLVCVAEVEAGEVAALQYDQKATVACRAFHDATLDGTLDRIGNQISKATLRPLDPRKQVDRDVAKVVVVVDAKKAARLINAAGKDRPLSNAADRRAMLVGLQVEVTFPLAKQSP